MIMRFGRVVSGRFWEQILLIGNFVNNQITHIYFSHKSCGSVIYLDSEVEGEFDSGAGHEERNFVWDIVAVSVNFRGTYLHLVELGHRYRLIGRI